MPQSPLLRSLADRVGIVPEYIDQTGRERRATSDATRIDLLAAMGIDASTEGAARDAFERLDTEARARCLDPVRVVRGPTNVPHTVQARIDVAGDAEYPVTLTNEDGTRRESDGRARVALGYVEVPLPIGGAPHSTGYHTMRVELRVGDVVREAQQLLIVAPERCLTPDELVGREPRLFGLTANLYSLRSARNWGVGDFTDLADVVSWGAEVGAAFVGVNPLHALHDRGGDISPYSPISRLFRNVIYIDVAAVPEVRESAGSIPTPNAARLARIRGGDRVHYDEVTSTKRRVLDLAFDQFVRHHRDGHTARGDAFREYVAGAGRALDDFATWMALSELFSGDPSGGRDWRVWPAVYRDPHSAEVAAFRISHRDRVDLHRWLQFEADRQLAGAAERARAGGMPVGVYQDLAVGSSPAGSDAWAYQSQFARGVSLGAPPDAYARQGQNWGLPPLDPRALAADGYRYWITLLRSAFRHAGALRIDHILGAFRQFWIADGKSGEEGAYVRFPTQELFAILALESRRAGAVVVGEDLGTVPPEVPTALKAWGIMSSKVLQFEREGDAAYKPSWTYEPLSLTTADTHDMATIAGFWRGRDIEIRGAVGLIAGEREIELARVHRAKERQRLRERLTADGTIDEGLPVVTRPSSPELAARGSPPEIEDTTSHAGDSHPSAADDTAALRGAVHAFLCSTPAALVGIALDDITGEVEPVNVPGVGNDLFPNWSRRMRMPIDDLRSSASVVAALRVEDRGSHIADRGLSNNPRG
ncbi:MAG: 4-alpha-glucanotransferase [Gemmatimonadaceae bacterium]